MELSDDLQHLRRSPDLFGAMYNISLRYLRALESGQDDEFLTLFTRGPEAMLRIINDFVKFAEVNRLESYRLELGASQRDSVDTENAYGIDEKAIGELNTLAFKHAG